MRWALEAHYLKLRRAYEHLHDLEKNIDVFINEQRDRTREYFEQRDDAWWYVVGSDPMPATPYWGVIVGDFAHNLRSLLDQLVWSLVEANKEKPGRHNNFPILPSLDEWQRHVETRPPDKPGPLEGVRIEAIAEIQWTQPYHAGNEPVALLKWLSNTDKHQLVHPGSITSADEPPVGLLKHPDGTVEELTDVIFHADVPLEEGADRVIEVPLPPGFSEERFGYVSVNRFPVGVAFGKRRVRYRDLLDIFNWVDTLLQRFAKQFF